jgi:hypothetical protein
MKYSYFLLICLLTAGLMTGCGAGKNAASSSNDNKLKQFVILPISDKDEIPRSCGNPELGAVVCYSAIPNMKFTLPVDPDRLISVQYLKEYQCYIICMQPTDTEIGGLTLYALNITAPGFIDAYIERIKVEAGKITYFMTEEVTSEEEKMRAIIRAEVAAMNKDNAATTNTAAPANTPANTTSKQRPPAGDLNYLPMQRERKSIIGLNIGSALLNYDGYDYTGGGMVDFSYTFLFNDYIGANIEYTASYFDYCDFSGIFLGPVVHVPLNRNKTFRLEFIPELGFDFYETDYSELNTNAFAARFKGGLLFKWKALAVRFGLHYSIDGYTDTNFGVFGGLGVAF